MRADVLEDPEDNLGDPVPFRRPSENHGRLFFLLSGLGILVQCTRFSALPSVASDPPVHSPG